MADLFFPDSYIINYKVNDLIYSADLFLKTVGAIYCADLFTQTARANVICRSIFPDDLRIHIMADPIFPGGRDEMTFVFSYFRQGAF